MKPPVPTLRIVGPGRAGLSLADALARCGWTVAGTVGRGDDPRQAARGVDFVVIATPDDVIAHVAAQIVPEPETVVVHLSGSLGADILASHPRCAALHPLATLPDRVVGADALAAGVWWAVEGDSSATAIVTTLEGRILRPHDRVAYHATACVAANHVVALMAQVERLAAANGMPTEPFYELAAAALSNARRTGASRALTGPAARGDRDTLRRHVAALPESEHLLYETLADAAAGEVLACR